MNHSVHLKNHLVVKFQIALKFLLPGIICLCAFVPAKAQGDLLISPLRVIFESSRKSQEINLANVGKDTATFAISVVDYRMLENGGFEQIEVPDSGQNFAGPFLRFFPRKVTLAPNEAQVIKLQLIKTSQMSPGEYRSHLYFRAVPDEDTTGRKASKKDSTGISISLKPIFGITIPVIVRMGENNADVTISELSFTNVNDTPRLAFAFHRTGDMSVYGDITIEHVLPSGKATQVKLAKGVGVYTPNAVRFLNMELDTDKNINYSIGKMRVTYTMQLSNKTEKVVVAELDLK